MNLFFFIGAMCEIVVVKRVTFVSVEQLCGSEATFITNYTYLRFNTDSKDSRHGIYPTTNKHDGQVDFQDLEPSLCFLFQSLSTYWQEVQIVDISVVLLIPF